MKKLDIDSILSVVPPDYYQKGIERNMLQKTWHLGKLKATQKLIQGNPKKILDVGCASGWFLSELAGKFPLAECYGVDLYEKAITYGNKRYKKLHLTVADAHKLPYKDNYFDLVICTEVLEHVLKPEKVLQEIGRVIKKDGTAIIEMDSGNKLFQVVWHWWTHMKHGVWEHAHIQVFNAKKLENLIKKSGFIVTKRIIFNLSMAVAFKAVKK